MNKSFMIRNTARLTLARPPILSSHSHNEKLYIAGGDIPSIHDLTRKFPMRRLQAFQKQSR